MYVGIVLSSSIVFFTSYLLILNTTILYYMHCTALYCTPAGADLLLQPVPHRPQHQLDPSQADLPVGLPYYIRHGPLHRAALFSR